MNGISARLGIIGNVNTDMVVPVFTLCNSVPLFLAAAEMDIFKAIIITKRVFADYSYAFGNCNCNKNVIAVPNLTDRLNRNTEILRFNR